MAYYLLMVRKGFSPTPNSIISAKTFDHVTTKMHDEALVHYEIHDKNCNGRFYLLATSSFSPKLGSLSSVAYLVFLIKVNIDVLVHDKTKRIVRTYYILDIYFQAAGSHESDAGNYSFLFIMLYRCLNLMSVSYTHLTLPTILLV